MVLSAGRVAESKEEMSIMLYEPEGLGSIPLDLGWNVRWVLRSAVGEAEIGVVSTMCVGLLLAHGTGTWLYLGVCLRSITACQLGIK